MTDKTPLVAKSGPYSIEMEPGTYYWCSCGRSARQPFCDGSHKGTSFTPVKHEVLERKKISWCGCKHSTKGCICDGSHRRLGEQG